MRDAFPMCGIQSIEDLSRVFHSLFHGKRSSHRSSLNELHDQVVGADIVKMANVRMVEGSDYLRFLSESFTERTGTDLDRHLAVKPRICSAVDFAHPARGNERLDAVRTQ